MPHTECDEYRCNMRDLAQGAKRAPIKRVALLKPKNSTKPVSSTCTPPSARAPSASTRRHGTPSLRTRHTSKFAFQKICNNTRDWNAAAWQCHQQQIRPLPIAALQGCEELSCLPPIAKHIHRPRQTRVYVNRRDPRHGTRRALEIALCPQRS